MSDLWFAIAFVMCGFGLGWALSGMFYIHRAEKELENYIQSQRKRRNEQ